MNNTAIVPAKNIKPAALKNKQMKAIAMILKREKHTKTGMYFNNVLRLYSSFSLAEAYFSILGRLELGSLIKKEIKIRC